MYCIYGLLSWYLYKKVSTNLDNSIAFWSLIYNYVDGVLCFLLLLCPFLLLQILPPDLRKVWVEVVVILNNKWPNISLHRIHNYLTPVPVGMFNYSLFELSLPGHRSSTDPAASRFSSWKVEEHDAFESCVRPQHERGVVEWPQSPPHSRTSSHVLSGL